MARAFLDACVLFPPLVRGCLLSAAAEGLFDPCWSPGVVDEWAWATARDHGPEAEAAARAEAASMAARWPGGLAGGGVEIGPEAEVARGLSLPDAGDVHVLAGAVDAGADLLVTFNLRDFPARKLAGLGLTPIHPDALLWELAGRDEAAMGRSLARALAPFPALLGSVDEAGKGLRRAGLPRLGKLLRRGEISVGG